MMRTILTTVGTSLLGNAGRALGSGELSDVDLANYLARTDPVRACAETNGLSRLLRDGDLIVFLHSHTDEGRRCAEALRRHYAKRGYRAELVEIPDLSYTESRFKLRGLRGLVAALAHRIERERERGRGVLINATGGFKAEIAYATLVGLLFDVPVYYIHELFQDLIEMPPVPVAWDYAVLADCEEFFEWIDAEPRATAAVDRRLQELPSEVRAQVSVLLSDEDDGCTYLSPAGEAFVRAYTDALERLASVPLYLSEQARTAYERADGATRDLWNRSLRKLRNPALRRSHSDQVNTSDCLVFPKGHRAERVFWFEREGAVYVCELARHGDGSYQRLLNRGVSRQAYAAAGFAPWVG
jgi:putative CRISPR-associated protein (TIGR02619 family)